MTNISLRSRFHPASETTPLVRIVVWLTALSFAAMLAFVRVATEAEFAFASTVMLPVIAVAWFVGKKEGVVYSALAAFVWVSSDIQAGLQFGGTWVPWVNGLTRFGVYALVAYLTSSLREVLIREYGLARRDALTGLLNRHAFFESGVAETGRARRYGHPLGIVFLDLDGFKRLNDTRGHKVGDLALKAVGSALARTLRDTDIVARLGGDEFAVVLPEIGFQSATEAGHKIENTIHTVLRDFSPVSVSIGVAWFENATDRFADMLDAADGLMYEVKEAGKHGVRSKQFPAVLAEFSSNEAT